jgi:hypothetical protein
MAVRLCQYKVKQSYGGWSVDNIMQIIVPQRDYVRRNCDENFHVMVKSEDQR